MVILQYRGKRMAWKIVTAAHMQALAKVIRSIKDGEGAQALQELPAWMVRKLQPSVAEADQKSLEFQRQYDHELRMLESRLGDLLKRQNELHAALEISESLLEAALAESRTLRCQLVEIRQHSDQQ